MSGKSERNAYCEGIYSSLANLQVRKMSVPKIQIRPLTLNLRQEQPPLEPVRSNNHLGSLGPLGRFDRFGRFGRLVRLATLAMFSFGALTINFLGTACLIQPALAQGSPLPGSANYKPASSAPVPGASGFNKPMSAEETMRSRYKSLPITAADAKIRLEELRSALEMGTPARELQERVLELGEWLTDAADAHYRMYQAFAKSELTKNQAASEKQLNQSFSQLKREAQLLKADLLIKQGRAPEALSPLVEIVVNDPRSQTGQAAYKKLTELGFSRDVGEDKQISGLETAKPAK